MLGLDTDIRRQKCDIFSAYANKSVKYWLLCALFFIPFLCSNTQLFWQDEGICTIYHNRRKKTFSTSSSSTYFFGVLSLQISLLMVITIHYKIPVVFISENIANSVVHISFYFFLFLCAISSIFFCCQGPENNLISCVL